MRPSGGIPNPALPEGGSTGAGNSNSSVTPTPVATVSLRIRSSCTGGSSSFPSSVSGSGPSGAAEALVKELLSVHPDPQRLTRAILTASSSYSNISNVQVRQYFMYENVLCREYLNKQDNKTSRPAVLIFMKFRYIMFIIKNYVKKKTKY